MAWNPETYNQFKSERFTPFYDLLELVQVKPGLQVIDLGCGTGELTRKLADASPDSQVTGIDSSAEMLEKSQAFEREGLRFSLLGIEEQLESDEKFDLIFSNAAVQWVEDHENLFSTLISKLTPGGQLVIQMPAQNHNLSNRLLVELAGQEPFREALQGWTRQSPVLDIEQYARILFENRCRFMTVFEKIYPLTLPNSETLFDWVSGTALIPYLEKLDQSLHHAFCNSYKELLKSHFDKSPVFYPFKRIILEARV
jgi:trans-aconitate 2-methyltransferase